VADALHLALSLGAEEKRRRLAAMKRHLRRHDVAHWATGLLSALEERPRRKPAGIGLEQAALAP
jgi:trehalose-6-phosphate synthase